MSLTVDERRLLEAAINGAVTFSYEPCPRGGKHAKLVASSHPAELQERFHDLAMRGYMAQAVNGTPGHSGPPTTVVSFTLTALGKAEVQGPKPVKRPSRWQRPATEAELEREGLL